jgi:hypothetical protein
MAAEFKKVANFKMVAEFEMAVIFFFILKFQKDNLKKKIFLLCFLIKKCVFIGVRTQANRVVTLTTDLLTPCLYES